MAQVEEQVSNKQVLASGYITGNPKQTDILKRSPTSLHYNFLQRLQMLCWLRLKNLYLSCDPYMRGTKGRDRNCLFYSFSPDSPIIGYGVCDSKQPDFKKGDFVWGVTKWEECSIITMTELSINIMMEGKVICVEDIAKDIDGGPATLEAMFKGS